MNNNYTIVFTVTYATKNPSQLEIEKRLNLFLKHISLKASYIYLTEDDPYKQLIMAWDYKLHQNLYAWNFNHTFLEVAFRWYPKVCMKLLMNGVADLYSNEQPYNFYRFGAPFVSMGIDANCLTDDQWDAYKNLSSLKKHTDLTEMQKVHIPHNVLLIKILNYKLSGAYSILNDKILFSQKLKRLMIRSLYDEISSIYIALDYQVNRNAQKKYNKLHNFLQSI